MNGLNEFMNSPGMAMAGTAMSNLTNMRQGRPVISPIQAYQQAIQSRAALRQNELLAQAQQQRLNPFYDYEQAIERGYITKDTPLKEFRRLMRGGHGAAGPNEFEYVQSLSPEDRKNYMHLKRNTQLIDLGGGRQGVLGPGGVVMPITSSGEFIANEAAEKSAVTGAEDWARRDAEFEATFPEQLEKLRYGREVMQRTRDLVESPNAEWAQGPIMGRIAQFYDPDAAQINATGVIQTLETLSQVTTGALSEGELALFESLSAKGTRTPEQNAALLDRALELVDRRLKMYVDKGRYYRDNKTLRGYGFDILDQFDMSPDDDLGEIP